LFVFSCFFSLRSGEREREREREKRRDHWVVDFKGPEEREREAIGSWGLQWDWVVDFKGLLLLG
jgi:hypothetical protein